MAESKTIMPEQLLDGQVGVLGCMLKWPDFVPMVLQQVRADDFTSPAYRTVYQAVSALFRDGQPVDAITVREKLGGCVGDEWSTMLLQLMDLTPTAANLDSYIDRLRESAMLFRLQDIGSQLHGAVDLDEARGILDKAMQMQVGRPSVQAITMADGYERFLDRMANGQPRPHLDWGIHELTKVVKAHPGDMIVLGGYPSDGKTALALQFADKIAQTKRVGYFSFESDKDQLFERHVSRVAMISSKAISDNSLTEDDYKELIQLQSRLTEPQLTIIDAVGMTAMDIEAYSQSHHYDAVVVDYLQKVETGGKRRMEEYDRVTEVSGQLQKFGRRTNTNVLALSQLSRPKEKGKKSPPTMSDLRSSGQIEQDADIIFLLYREEQDVKDSNRILFVAKNRNGEALDKVKLRFDGDRQTFSRIAPSYEPMQAANQGKKDRRQVTFWPERPDPNNPFLEEKA